MNPIELLNPTHLLKYPNQMKIYIKNMVCDRCNLVIKSSLAELSLVPMNVVLGEVDFGEKVLTADELLLIKHAVEPLGFELIDDKKSRLIENVKRSIIALVHQPVDIVPVKLSNYLSDAMGYDYSYLSQLFSSVEGITLEQYLIMQKIERVKELLVYDELSLTEIFHRLGYSSLAHLSGQFKKVTGMSPSQFKKLKDAKQRKPLDKV